MAEEAGEKTEEPTPHRLREAREKGQVAKSKEITTALLLIFSYMVFKYTGVSMWNNLTNMAAMIFNLIPNTGEFSFSFAGYALLLGIQGLAMAVAPIFGLILFVAFAAEALQTGLLFAADPLMPKIERISPAEGFKRMFSLQGFVELIKSIVKILIVFWITWGAIKDDIPSIVILINGQPWDAIVLGGNIAYKVALRVGLFYVAIALLDYLYKRWEYMRGLKMTKQEIKEEYKRLEGDPMIKQRMRELQRQVAYQRMMAAVPQADVVVTNPAHIAVALKYEAPKMKSPTVLAKGERKAAEEIKRIADSAYVPIVENEPLARSVYRTTDVGKQIPAGLYQAVAEVLAYVYKIKKKRTEKLKSYLGPTVGIRKP
ncbi:MAG: flagellar biosynthesis protein FlhB [bacterium]